jgi:hypothetical protein
MDVVDIWTLAREGSQFRRYHASNVFRALYTSALSTLMAEVVEAMSRAGGCVLCIEKSKLEKKA